MPICKKCQNKFPNKIIINNKEHCLHTRSYCLTCSPFKSGKGYEHRKEKTANKYIFVNNKLYVRCIECNREIYYKNRKSFHSINKVCSTCRSFKKRKETKIKCVEILGGKCEKCGISDIDILLFHHKNPSDKLFNISANLYNKNWDLVKNEVLKCCLLCHNCHVKLHKKK